MIVAKAKGTRRERQARDILESQGFAVTRAAGSLGLWDLIGLRRQPEPDRYLPVVKLVQVKSNRWPRTAEVEALEADVATYPRPFVLGEIWRFDDQRSEPRIRRVVC